MVAPGSSSATLDNAGDRPADTETPLRYHIPFRRDIQGLRAVAVVLVVLDHVVGWPSGGFIGVDIFFVISGFLITQLMLREYESSGKISILRFYRRRIRRIVPAAFLVLAVTVVASRYMFYQARFEDTVIDALWTAGFAANWRFALTGSDYLQADLAPSPLQHYWSLAVEEQFYLFWPVLLIVTLAIATVLRRGDRTFVAASLVLVAVVIVVSFAWTMYETRANPAVAYFSSLGRAWELGVGALLAIAAPYLRTILRRRVMAIAVVWIGLAGIAYSAVVINAESIFPGPEAALPVGAAALIIVSGIGFRDRTTVLLCNPVTDFLGKISYSLYLWHWPVVVILGPRLEMSPVLNQAILLSVSVLLATASFYLVEDPVRKSGWLRDSAKTSDSRTGFGWVVTGLVMTTLLCLLAFAPLNNTGGGAGTAQRSTGNSSSSAASSEGEPEGANALIEDPTLGAPTDEVPQLTPSVNSIADDVPQGYGDNCHQDQEGTEAKACVVDHSGADSKEQVVALVGDSHANQWRPAIEDLVKSEGMRLEVYTKSACPMNTATLVQPGASRPYSSCADWNSNVLDKLASNPPSMVLVSSSIYVSGFDDGEFVEGQGGLDLVTEGYRDAWSQLTEQNIAVVALHDTPAPEFDVIDCIFQNRDALSECSFSRDEGLEGRGVLESAAAESADDVSMLDLNEYVCPEDRCPLVIGGVVVYRDTNHMTASYSRSLGPIFTEKMQPILEEVG